MANDLSDFIVQQLEARGIRVDLNSSSQTDLKAVCFMGHDRATASLNIRRADGMFYCFGCGVKGKDWNALAAKIGGQKLDEEAMPDPFSLMNERIKNNIAKDIMRQRLPWNIEPWTHGRWRGLSPKLLTLLEAHRWYDDADTVRAYRILFPIRQFGDLRGWVARRLDNRNEMKYRNSLSLPAQELLYPYDFVAKRMNTNTIVIVEGPFDALRLINYGIPALAILGTNNYTEENKSLIASLDTERVIVATDSDEAGLKCRHRTLWPSLREWFEVEDFFAPRTEGKNDPGSMPMSYVKKLKEAVYR